MSKTDLSGLKIGMENTISLVVSDENTAEAVGYKGMPVLGTPHLVGLMEMACVFIHEFLPENHMTVGVANDMRHLAASPVGTTVQAKARLTAIEGKKLTFEIQAHDAVDKVADGIHTRFVVDANEFFANLDRKKQNLGLI